MTDIINQLRQASLSKEDYRWEAADLIQSLREKTQYWPDNAERDAVIRHQKEEIERLRAENFSLAAWQCEFTDGKTGLVAHEHGGTYCAMAKENERLRAALEPILNYPNIREKIGNQLYDLGCAALGFTPVPDGQPAPGKEEV